MECFFYVFKCRCPNTPHAGVLALGHIDVPSHFQQCVHSAFGGAIRFRKADFCPFLHGAQSRFCANVIDVHFFPFVAISHNHSEAVRSRGYWGCKWFVLRRRIRVLFKHCKRLPRHGCPQRMGESSPPVSGADPILGCRA